MGEKNNRLLLVLLVFMYASFTWILISGQEVDDVLVTVQWRDLTKLLAYTQEFNRTYLSNLTRGIFNAYPKMIIDMWTTEHIEPKQQEIFNYAAATNKIRKDKGLEPVQIWIKTEMRYLENKTSLPANSAVLLAQQPNFISSETIVGFIWVSQLIMDHPDTFAVFEEEAEKFHRVLLNKNLSLWIFVPVGMKCTTKRHSIFPYSKFSFGVYSNIGNQECPSPPYANYPWMNYTDDCIILRESFTPLRSPKMVNIFSDRKYMHYFADEGTGSFGTYGNFTYFLMLKQKMMTKCEIYIIPEVEVVVVPPSANLDRTIFDRNHVGFSLYFDMLPQNVTAVFQEILHSVSKITITNIFNLTNESVAQINSTVFEILNFKRRIEGGFEFAEIDNVPIEISILLDRFEDRSSANEIPYLEILDKVFENAVSINKASVKIISLIVITGYNTEYSWQEMLSHLEFLEESFPDQAVYGPEFGFAVNVHHCFLPNVASIIEELKNSSVNVHIWTEDKLSFYESPFVLGVSVSNFSDPLGRLELCKKTFQVKGFKSEKFFFYSTILKCKQKPNSPLWGGEREHMEFIRRLNDMLNSDSDNFLIIHSALERSKFQTIHSDVELCNASDPTKLPACARTQICGWWRVYEHNDLGVMPVIKDKRTILEDKRYPDLNTIPTSSSTGHSEATLIPTSTKEATSYTSSPPHNSNIQMTLLLVLVVIGVLLLTISSVYVWFRYRHKRILSKSEVQEFYNGSPNKTPVTGTDVACSLKYNMTLYEIARSAFDVDTTRYIGSGEFGIVYPGTIKSDGIDVAIKTLKKRCNVLEQSAVPSLRGLLSEIKILSFLGEHKNIVKLFGANTDKLSSGNIFVILEMCSFGSLGNYLRKLKRKEDRDCHSVAMSSTRSLFESSEEDECIPEYDFHPGVKDKEMQDNLYKWSKEIACGMEYIASKKLVHADLATRNVLLDANKTAKIADFGLSRRLYDYTHYLKTSHEPLPWRWMAPEALKRLEFCEKTDVWAYGITLWEIYMLGDTPYPGLSWDVNFPNMLADGLTPGMPTYDNRKMYAIMKQCWEINPELRPTFLDLVEKIDNACENQNLEGYIAVW